MVISAYYGHGKPPLQLFLTPFVDELKNLLQNNFQVNGHTVSVKVSCFICDTPARSFIKGFVIN